MAERLVPTKVANLTLPTPSPSASASPAASTASLSGNLSEAAEIARLSEELDAGEEHITALQTELDSCKEETLKLRSKAASVALSLERLKEELHELLQSEAELRSNSQRSNSQDLRQEPPLDNEGDTNGVSNPPSSHLHCHATLCALTGQLEATRSAVERAVHERDDLLRKMSEDGTMAVGDDDESPRDASASALTFFNRLLAAGDSADARPDEMDLIQLLNAQAAERSAYRDDHARIWRDITLPNVSLLRPGAKEAHCGVVAERLFAGLTEFSAMGADGFVAEHCYLSSCGPAEKATDEQFHAVRHMYGALVLRDRGATSRSRKSPELRVVAPRQALERVLQLVRTAADHKAGTPLTPRTPTTPNTPGTPRSPQLNVEPPKPKEEAKIKLRPGPRLSQASHVLASEHFRFLVQECIPVRFHESDVELLYSTNNDGMSVHTLYQRCRGVSPTIVAVRDHTGAVFGCYAATPWKETAPRYYGTGECFVFSCRPRLAVYKWNRKTGNSFFQFSHGDILAIGGGDASHYALWVDEDLGRGTTAKCATFDSPPLNGTKDTADNVDFEITVLEVWTVIPRTHGRSK